MKKRKLETEERSAVVKCGLKTSVTNPIFIHIIERYILNISKRIHRAGLLLNHYVLKTLESNTPPEESVCSQIGDQMLYYAALTLGSRSKYPDLISFFRDNQNKYESIEDLSGYGSSLNSAARSMKTNMNNYLFMTFDQRILKSLKDLDKSEKNAVLRRIKCFDCRKSYVFREQEQTFIDTCKSILGAGDMIITDKWIMEHPFQVLKLFRFLIQRCESSETKGFTILPIFHLKRHFITIDAVFLRTIMLEMGLIQKTCDVKTFRALKEDHFRSVFKLRNTWKIGGEMKTDGIALCVNVIRRKNDEYEDDDNTNKKKTSTKVQYNRKPGDENNYFSNDPGNVNLASVIQVHNGEIIDKVGFTKWQYKHESNININTKKRRKLDKFVEEELSQLSHCCTKTSSSSTFETYLTTKVPMYDKLWVHYGDKKFARMSFDTYIRSSSSLDGFFLKLSKTKKFDIGNKCDKPLMKFGKATWDPGKGWTSGPTKKMIFHARKFFRVVLVDEYNTTKMCCTCQCKMEPVKQKFIGPLRQGRHRWNMKCRGLMRCRSNVCLSVPLKARDYNAAINIGKAWPFRPTYLCRPLDMLSIQHTSVVV
jgi:hypothetical protein